MKKGFTGGRSREAKGCWAAFPVRGASHLDGMVGGGQQSGLGGNIDALQNEEVGNKDAAVGKARS